MLAHYLEVARPWLEEYGYFMLFATVFVEGFGVPVPGQTLIMASALLAEKGDMHIAAVFLVAWSAAVMGDNAGYLIGRWGGRKLLLKLRIKPAQLDRMEYFFTHYGSGIVIFARFVDVLRQLNGVVAGSMGMPWRKFVLFNALGAALWVGLWGGGVYFLSQYIAPIEMFFKATQPYLIALGLLALVAVLLHVFASGRSKQSATPANEKNNE